LACASGALFVAAAVPSLSRADRHPDHLADMDDVLLEADFIGVVEVVSRKDAGGNAEATLRPAEQWASRWDVDGDLTIRFRDSDGEFRMVQAGKSLLVMLSGGPWQRSPFTFRSNGIFVIERNGVLTCASGNPLFGSSSAGSLCSRSDLVATPPLNVAGARDVLLRLRATTLRRRATEAAALDPQRRPLRHTPSPSVDRSAIGQRVLR
jgi:hypothetical protein